MSTPQEITPALRAWMTEQLASGHSAASVLDAMHASGWHTDVAMAALQDCLQGESPEPVLPHVAMTGNTLWAHDRFIRVVVSMAQPQVVVLADVLSLQECEELMAAAEPALTRSETVQDATGHGEVNEARTSQGMFFGRKQSPLIERIEARLAALLNWPTERGEGLQVLRYAPGAEYRPHHDYFDPDQPGTPAVLKRGGQRVGTLVIYLNAPPEGGMTTFPELGLNVHPAPGHAVFFSYAVPLPATRTLHGGSPVIQGEKWVATKWLRQHRFD